jgi:hypothetical protein
MFNFSGLSFNFLEKDNVDGSKSNNHTIAPPNDYRPSPVKAG